ncbi:MAG: HD domain-containing protein [Treponema sp.]|nr:HD domain-containing protein [Treponema sp.]
MSEQKAILDELKSIEVSDLKAGLAFSEAVYIDEDNLLVPADISILQKDMDMLETLGVDIVYTAGKPLRGGTLKSEDARRAEAQREKEAFEEKMIEESASKASMPYHFTAAQKNVGTYRIYRTLIERINEIFLRISEGSVISNRPINAISTQLLQALRDHREQYISFVLGSDVKGYEMAKSAVNIAILSALTAQEIRLPSHKILYVIIGALLHDAGMFQLPKKILDKKEELTAGERKQIRGHPLLSREIVVRELSYPDEIGDIVLQHHERWDGNGYPYRLPGNNITIGARIVSIVDSFEAMVSHKPYRSSIVGYQANKNLLADNSRRFDPDILKVFILTMGVYPIGSIVRLNNGMVVRISEVRASTPLRPKVQVLVDEFNHLHTAAEGTFIDLLTEKRLYIIKALDTQDLSEINAQE